MEALSDLAFHAEFDLDSEPPTMSGARLLDLAAVGSQFALRAGRLLVRLEGLLRAKAQ